MKLFVVLASLAFMAVLPAAADDSCQLNAVSMQQAVISCMAHEPVLMIQIAEHFQDPSSMENLDFVCKNQGAMVEMLVCLESKLVKCMPQGGNMLRQMLPDKQHMSEGISYMCQHRKLLTDHCMDKEVSRGFMQCYMGQLQPILATAATSLTSKAGIKSALCSIIGAEKACLKLHHGTCSNEFVNEAMTLLETFFNTDKCPASSMVLKDVKGQLLKGAFGANLLGGAPLQFQSENGGRRYN